MAATAAGRLFSLELLVDWVRLEFGLAPCAGNPAVAFRLLDFPPLLVLPPAASAQEPRSGTIDFGRGKACLLRLRPAALRRPRLRAAVLQLPEGPASAPCMLGACDILLVASQGRRGKYTLRGPAAERVGELALFYRLTDLGRFPPGVPELQGPLNPESITSEAMEVWEPPTQETSKPCTREATVRCLQCASDVRRLEASEPCPKDTNSWSAGDSDPSAVQKTWEEAVLHSKAGSGDMASAPCSPATSGRTASPLSQEVTELDFETNTFCPPPLYYTHLIQEKTPPARVEITIETQRNGPEEPDGIYPETKPIGPPVHPVKHTRSTMEESPPVLLNPPQTQGPGAVNEVACPQTEQNTANAIRQLPLLNALLIELSLLCNQPVASPAQVHPHLAWLYRGEHKGPELSAKSTSRSELKSSKLSVRESEKPVSLQPKKNPKGKRSEKISGSPPPRAAKGRLLYGLTNTLRLRLKQTNPDMLVVHEKREQYRKSQIQTGGPKFRVPSWKGKVPSLETQSQMPPQPPEKPSDSSGSFAEVDQIVEEGKDVSHVKVTDLVTSDAGVNRAASRDSSCKSISELEYQEELASLCYSEDFCMTENNSRSLLAPGSSTGAENAQHSSQASKSSEARLSTRKTSSEMSVLSPPFSAGSPVCSHKRSHVLKTPCRSLEEASSSSTSDLSQWTNEKENQADALSTGSSKVMRTGRDSSTKLKGGAGRRSSEKSQSPRTSQVSSYEPSNLSELELKGFDNSESAEFQKEEDDLGPLNFSKQCRDICELVINKLPGYTV
ncbi:Microtubule-associated protein 10 [Microtus ochrogaster]|uniref:Microtubule-associated protein 10 n=1 Tax=Microtus ochrogaster TaxID=79684 RepID=A0A8J6KZ07_MICOH|nr:Microtubule-associated protein 10 [Microtus ochrogaster]